MFNTQNAWTMVVWAILLSLWFTLAQGMRDYQIKELRYGLYPTMTPRLAMLNPFPYPADKKLSACSIMASRTT